MLEVRDGRSEDDDCQTGRGKADETRLHVSTLRPGTRASTFIKEAPFANEISHVSNAAAACGWPEACREADRTLPPGHLPLLSKNAIRLDPFLRIVTVRCILG